MSPTYMSRKGHKKLKEKFDYLTKVKRKEIADKLEHARGFGDLKENAEYNAAKEALSLNEIQIKELVEKLTSVEFIDDLDIPDDKVYIGATVFLKDLNRGEELKYILVSDTESDILEDKIAVSTPIGKGLLGHEVGDVVTIQVPVGELKYEIVKITRDN